MCDCSFSDVHVPVFSNFGGLQEQCSIVSDWARVRHPGWEEGSVVLYKQSPPFLTLFPHSACIVITQLVCQLAEGNPRAWIPAFAGMTDTSFVRRVQIPLCSYRTWVLVYSPTLVDDWITTRMSESHNIRHPGWEDRVTVLKGTFMKISHPLSSEYFVDSGSSPEWRRRNIVRRVSERRCS